MQDGFLIIPKNGEATFWVRRSYERALDESLFPNIKLMDSFRDAAKDVSVLQETVYLETEKVPLALYQRFQKYFPFKEFRPADPFICAVRAVKSEYELALTRQAGRIHQHVLEDLVPDILRPGVGLLIDELPVIAKGFDEPLEKGMVFALEPKKGIKGVGMVGIENTFIVTEGGGECITGKSKGLISVY